MEQFSYYYATDTDNFNFFRLPKKLVRDKMFSGLSSDAKILYGLLMDRMALSVKNGWLDEEGRVYIIFTIQDIAEEFFCSTRKALNLLNELNLIGLIERKRRGMGRPNLIYVKNFNAVQGKISKEHQKADSASDVKNWTGDPVLYQEVQEHAHQEVQEHAHQEVQERAHQEAQERAHQEVQNPAPQKETDRKDTDYIYNQSIYLSGKQQERWMDRKTVLKILKRNTGYDALIHDNPNDAEQIAEIVELLADTYCQTGQYISFGGKKIPATDVRERIMTIGIEHMRYVLQCMKRNTGMIKNIRGYLLSCLYNAPVTIHSYYRSQVQYDLAKDG